MNASTGSARTTWRQQPVDGAFDFYVHRNNQFRLPDAETDVIMIGPGTGIAPFRSFLWERDATGGSGRNWLFFGEQHFVTDFLYQTRNTELDANRNAP